MRAFIVLCLVALVSCDKLGYNYQPVTHSHNGLSFTPGASVQSNEHLVFENLASSQESPVNAFVDSSHSSAGQSANSYNAPAELEKEFYTFSAPDAEFEDANAAQRIAGSVKQGLRVVFIKGPETHGYEDAALALAKQAGQQQTAIYVLNKQADIGDLVNKLNAAGKNANNKPEVHFVKYRTAEDANNAQNAIQSQYDSLGGKSHSINGGVAPVINFASQAAVHAPISQVPQSSYLPSSIFRHRS